MFNCPKSAMHHHNQRKQPYYEATVIIQSRETTVKIRVDKQKIKTFVYIIK